MPGPGALLRRTARVKKQVPRLRAVSPSLGFLLFVVLWHRSVNTPSMRHFATCARRVRGRDSIPQARFNFSRCYFRHEDLQSLESLLNPESRVPSSIRSPSDPEPQPRAGRSKYLQTRVYLDVSEETASSFIGGGQSESS